MNPEVWTEDLSWARTLLEQQKVAQRVKKSAAPAEATHVSPKSIPDYDFESDEIVAVCAAIAEKQKPAAASKTMVIVSASGTVETVTEQEDGTAPPDGSVFIKARWGLLSRGCLNLPCWSPLKVLGLQAFTLEKLGKIAVCKVSFSHEAYKN